ncbi:hypothetical protein ACWFNE_15010 [Cellulomonas sp. NPDC055163]
MSRSESIARGIGGTVAVVGVGLATLWGLWFTVVAFTGGRLPVPGDYWTTGSVGFGLLMLFVGIPILDTVAYWVCALLVLVLTLPLGLASSIAGRDRSGAGRPLSSRSTAPHRAAAQSIKRYEVPVAGGIVKFTRRSDGGIDITASGYGGQPSPEVVHLAKRRLAESQASRGEAPWYRVAEQSGG